MASLSNLGLRLAGWEKFGQPPALKKYVFLAVPHTSNWDGLMLLTFARAFDLDMHWMIKNTWFKPPMSWLLRSANAVPVERTKKTNMVDAMVAEFARRDEFVLTIPPAGTRSHREYWKSGFYHIAIKAQVPIVLGLLDYRNKRAGFGPVIELTGDMSADMEQVRAYYESTDFAGRRPEATSRIRLKGEEDAADSRATTTTE